MSDTITEIPDHIRNLPEEDQGPALVKAIHDRKTAEQLRVEFNAEMHAAMREQFQLGLRAGIISLRSSLAAAADHVRGSHLHPGVCAALEMLEMIEKEILEEEEARDV